MLPNSKFDKAMEAGNHVCLAQYKQSVVWIRFLRHEKYKKYNCLCK